MTQIMQITQLPPKHGLIGHRGLAGHAPENTILSFQTAASKGLTWAEFDVQLSKDNQLVIFHDEHLNRTSNGQGAVHQTNFETITQLDAGSWYHPDYRDLRIPNLSKQLKDLLALNLYYNIELKCPHNPTVEYTTKLGDQFVSLIKTKWPKQKPLPLVSSFDWDLVLRVRKSIPNLPIGFLCESITPDLVRLAAQTPNSAIHCHYKNLHFSEINQINKINIPLLAYTVNDQETAANLLNQGVFAVFTDNLTEVKPDIRKAV